VIIGGGSGSFLVAEEFKFETCHARWSETELVIGNTCIERKWNIQNGVLTATSFRDLKAGVEWIASPAEHATPTSVGESKTETRSVSISAHAGQLSPVGAESLVVDITVSGRQTFHYQFQISSGAAGIRIQPEAQGVLAGETDHVLQLSNTEAAAQAPTGDETAAVAANHRDTVEALEDLTLTPEHLRFTQVTLADQTDNHNELVTGREWLLMPNEQAIVVRGDLFICENALSGAGLVFLKEAPLPDSRPEKSEWDAQVNAKSKRIRLASQGYPVAVLAYSGGRNGRIEALQAYQRQVRGYAPARDGLFLSNTWGDRSRDARINEGFMLQEIQAGSRLGVDVIQIDDGWQKGHSINSASGGGVWLGFWAADPHFWDVDRQRMPGGLEKLVNAAREKGMKFGLWYAPDSSQDFANWRRDADRILELWRTDGIEYFKLDSIKMTSPTAQANLRYLFERILGQSKGQIVMDLDVTAGVRPGYFGALEVGPIFVENRYTDFHRYWPHQTLRNLWQLAQYIDPLRLRMEFLNNERNTNLYLHDPLAPAAYSPDCLFAMVMAASPLGWFETSNLSSPYSESVARLARLWKQERSAWFAGTIIPVGDVPDGVSWTGFASVAPDHRAGYLLMFRELSQHSEWSADLSMFAGARTRATVLAGGGAAEIERDKLMVQIRKPLDYLWLRIETCGDKN
jgi:alpha-galactosidase